MVRRQHDEATGPCAGEFGEEFVTQPENDYRRKGNRRFRMLRNLFAYFNRRNLFRRGRRKNEERYEEEPDWFERERDRNRKPEDTDNS